MPPKSSPKQLASKPERYQQSQLAEREAHERALDKTLADTFPASDPLSSIPDPAAPDAADDDLQAA